MGCLGGGSSGERGKKLRRPFQIFPPPICGVPNVKTCNSLCKVLHTLSTLKHQAQHTSAQKYIVRTTTTALLTSSGWALRSLREPRPGIDHLFWASWGPSRRVWGGPTNRTVSLGCPAWPCVALAIPKSPA